MPDRASKTGFVVEAADAIQERGDGTARTWVTIDAASGSDRLTQRIVALNEGRSGQRSPPDGHQEISLRRRRRGHAAPPRGACARAGHGRLHPPEGQVRAGEPGAGGPRSRLGGNAGRASRPGARPGSEGHRALPRPADDSGRRAAGVPLPRQRGPWLPRRHPVRRSRPTESSADALSRVRRGRLHRRGRRRDSHG